MKSKTVIKLISTLVMTMMLTSWHYIAAAQSCTEGSTCINVDKGNDPYSKEVSRQMSEQWNDTHRLRGKVNTRIEKQFDKWDSAIDDSETCNTSSNLNAYWEPDTRRCLDRNTGQLIRR